ncbi:hypothetical protein [Streptomyces sp. NPDC001985]|uniref:hypothetical protein n=1 Tax=Streptomyces sp. NPDC001985 TaxID=3154406 RepID=UPI00332BF116
MWEGTVGRLFGRRERITRSGSPGRAEHAGTEAAITAFGIELDEHTFAPGQPGATDGMRDDLRRALDAYDEAKREFAGAGEHGRDAVLGALRALDTGRHALACLDARLAGREPPERLPLCFFDPRHGVSTTRVLWTPEGGAARPTAVCAADAARLADGLAPMGAPPTPPPAAPGTRERGAVPASPWDAVRRRPRLRMSGSGRPGPVAPDREDRPHGRETSGGRGRAGTPGVVLPVVGEPAVLLFRTERPVRVTVVFKPPRSSDALRTYTVGDGSEPATALLPLVRAGDRSVIRFSVTFPDHERTDWWARSEGLDAVADVDVSAEGRGYALLRYTGPAGRIAILRHRGRGSVLLQALDAGLREGEVIVRGKGDTAAAFEWPGPGYYQIRARGAWDIGGAD